MYFLSESDQFQVRFSSEKMKSAIIILVLIAIVAVNAQKKDKDNSAFKKYQKKFNKEYKNKNSESIDRRARIVQRRADRIKEINANDELPFVAGPTPFDDMESDERVQSLCGMKQPSNDGSSESVERRTRFGRIKKSESDSDSSETPSSPTFRALPAAPKFNSYTLATVPAKMDWTSYCMPVVNQNRCGSCWAFAALGVVGES